ncbi:MAG: cytochrome c biogenesis protein ResB [Verrucomicrobiota bacterium]
MRSKITKEDLNNPARWHILLFKVFSSFTLATIVLALMTLITLYGTYYQVEHGLVEAKRKYFDSYFVVHKFFGIVPLPLPGGLLLMMLLFINMVLGALIKVKKSWRGAGLLISHLGMLMLLLGGYITWAKATDGYIALYPGNESNQVQSYRKWQLEVMPLDEENRATEAHVISSAALRKVRKDEKKQFALADLPFDVVVNGFHRNANVIPTTIPVAADVKTRAIDGFKLAPQPLNTRAEQNLPGCYVAFEPAEGKPIETILWAASYNFDPNGKPRPFIFEVDGKSYAAQLAKKTWQVPYSVRLDKFIFEKHPGTSTPRTFESMITRIEEGRTDRPVNIKMNEPMRHGGYTFFQESYGPNSQTPVPQMFSQFAVANNPSDQWPLYSLIVTGIGLTIHFLISLILYIIRSFRRKS